MSEPENTRRPQPPGEERSLFIDSVQASAGTTVGAGGVVLAAKAAKAGAVAGWKKLKTPAEEK